MLFRFGRILRFCHNRSGAVLLEQSYITISNKELGLILHPVHFIKSDNLLISSTAYRFSSFDKNHCLPDILIKIFPTMIRCISGCKARCHHIFGRSYLGSNLATKIRPRVLESIHIRARLRIFGDAFIHINIPTFSIRRAVEYLLNRQVLSYFIRYIQIIGARNSREGHTCNKSGIYKFFHFHDCYDLKCYFKPYGPRT